MLHLYVHFISSSAYVYIMSHSDHSLPTTAKMFRHDMEIPVNTRPRAQPVKRHHSARYFAQRVRESLTTRVSKILCSIFLSLLFLLGLITFILWLSLRPHRPRIFIQDFSIPGLGQPSGFENAQVMFNVTARNSNQIIGIYYDSLDGAVFYKDQQVGSTPLLFPFFQGPKNTTVVAATLTGASLTVNSQRWTEFTNDLSRGTVVFHLDLTATIRFKISSWDSRHHQMHASCEVGVGPDGNMLALYKNKRCPEYFS